MVIHAAGEGFLHIFLEGVGRDGDNGYRAGIFAGKAADSLCGLISVHSGHLDIHEDGIKGTRGGRGENVHRLSAVMSGIRHNAHDFQELFRDLQIQLIVLCDKDPLTLQHCRQVSRSLFVFCC